MKLIDEIIEILSSEEGKLSDALIKTKVLLHRIGHKDLVGWVNSELAGYPDSDSVPEYRVLRAQVLVNASNGVYTVSSHPIPLSHLDEEYRESLKTSKLSQSLAVLERFIEKDGESLSSPIPPEHYGLLEKGLDDTYHIQRAWCQISIDYVAQVVIQIRSRLLDFLLELKEQLPDEVSSDELESRIDAIDAGNLFSNAIFGDNTTIQVGSGSTQTAMNVSVVGDFENLSKTLNTHGVSDEDVKSLRNALSEDESVVDADSKEFGPAVKEWLKAMLAKAVETSWQIEIGVASSVLATALQRFYGWI